MNREIKFRGKCSQRSKYAGEWVYGNLVVPQEVDCNEALIIKAHSSICSSSYHVDLNTVGQFIGMCASGGVEIYEGDIVVGDNEQVTEEIKLVVKYGIIERFVQGENLNLSLIPCFYFEDIKTKKTLFPILDYADIPHGMKVVGNIYDNPELLED